MLLDTSGLFGLHHRKEPCHDAAVHGYRAARRRLTHSYILAEFLALATARRIPREPAITFLSDLVPNPRIEVFWVDEPLHREAIELLRARPDKRYSLCDAVSFVLMNRHGIREALTTDHHFEQEGFQRLLKST